MAPSEPKTPLPTTPPGTHSDVIIIGGGPAGLSAAHSIVRSLHKVTVFDSGSYRNSRANAIRTIPTWDDGTNPEEWREKSKRDLVKGYAGVGFVDSVVTKVRGLGSPIGAKGFEVQDERGRKWSSSKLILATGIADVLLDIEGYENCWRENGIFHCLIHRGYEERGCPNAGVLSAGGDASLKAALHIGSQARNLTPNVTIYTNGNEKLTQEVREAMEPLGFTIDGRKITKLTKLEGRARVMIEFEGAAVNGNAEAGDGEAETGNNKTESFLVHRPLGVPNGPFATDLGLKVTEMGFIETSQPFYETSVSGCFAIGDCAVPFRIASQAMATGSFAANGVQMQLNADNVKTQAQGMGAHEGAAQVKVGA